MGEIEFMIYSVVLPGIVLGAVGLLAGLFLRERQKLAITVVWAVWAAAFMVAFLINPDLRMGTGWPQLGRPGFLLLVVPLAAAATLVPVWWGSRWAQPVAWLSALAAILAGFAMAYRWAAKDELFGDGSALTWFVLTVLGVMGFAWTWQRALNRWHWLAVPGYGMTAVILAACVLFHMEISMAQTVGIITALTVGAGVGSGLGRLPLYAANPALPITVGVAALVGMARVGASTEDTVWLPTILLVVAWVPWAVISFLPFIGRKRLVGEIIGATIALALLLTAAGVAADAYMPDTDGAAEGDEAGSAYDAYGL